MDTNTDGVVVNLNDWVGPSRTFTTLCDEASTILITPLGRDDPQLPQIAAGLTTALKELDQVAKPSGQTQRALHVLNNIAAHSRRDVFGAIEWLKRLAALRTTTPPTTDVNPNPVKRRPRHRRDESQLSLWTPDERS